MTATTAYSEYLTEAGYVFRHGYVAYDGNPFHYEIWSLKGGMEGVIAVCPNDPEDVVADGYPVKGGVERAVSFVAARRAAR